MIVGAGMAGVRTAVALRESGHAGPVVVVGAERHPPYDRPPLSKALLLGQAESSAFDIDFAALDVQLRLGLAATRLRPDEREIDTAEGPIAYDALVLACGARPLTLPGTEGLPGVHVLRTLDDVERLRPVLEAQHEIAIVGAGWIGAEFTTAARAAGCAVTVLEAADLPLAGALPAEITAPMAAWYEESGATLLTGTRVEHVEEGAVVLTDGRRIAAGAVLVGIGARPATSWLAGSGVALDSDAAVRADAWLRTSLPDVYAVGDCASFPSARYGERLLVHHWDNALQGPVTVAGRITGATREPYDPVPYFWSEQFGRFVQYAGHHTGADRLVARGDRAGAAWSAVWLRDGVLVALLAVGRPRDLAQGRKLIESGARLDPERAADPAVPLRKSVL